MEQRGRLHAQCVCEGEYHVKRWVADAAFDAGQVAPAHAHSAREFLLLDARSLAKFPHATAEPHMRRFADVWDLTAHPHSLWPHGHPTTQGGLMPDVAPTLVDDSNRTYLVLRVAVAHDHTEGAAAQTRWCADVADPASPLAGLYAFGESLPAVRHHVRGLRGVVARDRGRGRRGVRGTL